MQNKLPFDIDKKPEQISGQFGFTEGPAADAEGNVYFTDQPNNRIWEYSTENELTVFSNDVRRANGMYFDGDGSLVACADEKGELVAFSKSAKKTSLTNPLEPKRYNGPNDLWIAPNGGIYFTDPYYERDYWPTPKPEQHKENTYYLPPGSKDAVVADSTLQKPNGIIGTPDGKTLYIADIGGGKIYKFDIDADGSLSNRQKFIDKGSDGVALDENGNFYITGDGVTIFNSKGDEIGHIPIQEDWTANLCFGGKDNNKLFITASKSLYVMPMQVKGLR